jgi:uncharacterized protein YndB with AHSA1/START domain
MVRLRDHLNERSTVTDVLLRFDTEAEPKKVIDALTTNEGIRSFWTSQADVPSDVGGTLELSFSVAPKPFDLKLDQADDRTVVWHTESFPPHWVGTTIRWEVEPREVGSTVGFRHEGFKDDEEAGRVAFTWGMILVQLKELVEKGSAQPVFS